MEYLEQQIQNDPGLVERMEQIERFTQSYALQYPDGGTRAVVTIPVVVHVVYRTSTENISDAQIQSQIDVLNADFRRLNSDADNVWSQAADAEIEFCLATVDPCGRSTNGITRTVTTTSGFGKSNSLKSDDLGGKDAWPADEYMNLWVCNIGGGTLGYAQFPGGAAATDGVVIDYRYMGTSGTATAPFDLGRTGTHEVGHYLNLRHIWGDGGCGVDDFISDTPDSDAENYGCAIGHVSCMTTDMVQNYMDYSDDACMNLFTSGQKTRMKALFGAGGSRVGLLTSNGCGTPNDSVDVAFVIDNTGSMSEEIAGVRNALLSTLSTYDASSCGTVFQLTTFKDGFTINDTTTDLSIIQAQVSALTASGGGDCPEASVEAINAAQAKVKDNGTVFVATDASPHAGLDIEAAKNALTARGIRVSTILSGDCSSIPTVAGTAGGSSSSIPDPDMAQVPYSDNQNPSGTSSSPTAAGVPNSFSAIETFSYLAKETGGAFAFIPEVNGGTTAEKLRYENTAFNIIQGGITQSVAFSEPKRDQQGGTLSVTFTGANTHFDPHYYACIQRLGL
ncbi:UNVERIFIED_CONTAM: hypothetical protein GTU68_065460 [Idotea baltica]|nr:hypothetical protein [Idotea baltica]